LTIPETQTFVEQIADGLNSCADLRTKEWWERYMKGEARFRGVKMADTRRVVRQLVDEHGLADASAETFLALALACLEQPDTEDKLAGVLLLAEHGLNTLTIDHVDRLGAPLNDGAIANWNVCDWYCVKVLGPFVTAGSDIAPRARAIAGWTGEETLWQRRSAAVAFVYLAPTEPELFPGFTELLLDVSAVNVADPTRWSQTSIGWLLRELSARSPDQVREFVAAHPEMSGEARRAATARLIKDEPE
jgi:3-methyladenine DNA glycosylase AlkD